MEKMEEWFITLNQKMDRIGTDVIAIRGELSEVRDFIEQQQTDLRLCKLAIQRVDGKVDSLEDKVDGLEEKVDKVDEKVESLTKIPH